MFYICGTTVHTIEIVHYMKRKQFKKIINIEKNPRFKENGSSIYTLKDGPYKTTIAFHNILLIPKITLF